MASNLAEYTDSGTDTPTTDQDDSGAASHGTVPVEDDSQRPDDCECLDEYILDDPKPCWACCREGFDTPNPHPENTDSESGTGAS
jgi:hypothetical protein